MSRLTQCTICDAWIGSELHTAVTCVNNLRAALAHERDRARRVVRVFWRVKHLDGVTVHYGNRSSAFHSLWKYPGCKVYRVVVRRVAKKATT